MPRRDTYVLIDVHQLTSFSLFNFQGEIKCPDWEVDGLGVVTPDLTEEVQDQTTFVTDKTGQQLWNPENRG